MFENSSNNSDVFTAGANLGYAWFIGKHLSIEPSIRTNYEVSDSFNNSLDLNLNLGVSVHF